MLYFLTVVNNISLIFLSLKVSSEMSSYETNSFGNGGGMWWGWWPRVNEGRDASEVFKSADVSVLHDAYLHKMKGKF